MLSEKIEDDALFNIDFNFNQPIILKEARDFFKSISLSKLNYNTSTSSSKSLIFNTIYNGKPVFIKMFCENFKYENHSIGMLYEQKIYRYLKERHIKIKNIYKPYFIQAIDLFKIRVTSEFFIEFNSKIKNIDDIILHETKLVDDKKLKHENTFIGKTEYINDAIQYNPFIYFIITENIEGLSLYDYLMIEPYDFKVFIELIFELLYGIYLMNIKLKIRHNDLHFNNIIIKKLDFPIRQIYKINNKKYTRMKNFQVCIYDFDNSYLYNYNNEYLITRKFYSFNNKVNNTKDIWTLLHSIRLLLNSNKLNKDDVDKLYAIFLINPVAQRLFHDQKLNSDNLVYWGELCKIRTKEEPCDEPDFSQLHPDKVIQRFIHNYFIYNRRVVIKDRIKSFVLRKPKPVKLTFTNISDYKEKYIKYKTKYLKLKNELSYYF